MCPHLAMQRAITLLSALQRSSWITRAMGSTMLWSAWAWMVVVLVVARAASAAEQHSRRKVGLRGKGAHSQMLAPQGAAAAGVKVPALERHAIFPTTHQSYKNRYPDGTDGSKAYHSGNIIPGGLENPQVKGRRFDEQTHWHNNPYWKYFKQSL